MESLIAASMCTVQASSPKIQVGDTVFVTSISRTTAFRIMTLAFDTHVQTIFYHLQLRTYDGGVSVIAREDHLSLARTREEVDQGTVEGESRPRERKDDQHIGSGIRLGDVQLWDIFGAVEMPSHESRLSGLPENARCRIVEMESVKRTKDGPSLEYRLPSKLLQIPSPTHDRGLRLPKNQSAGEHEENTELRYATLHPGQTSIEDCNAARSRILAASRRLEVMHGRHSERTLSEPLMGKLQSLRISQQANNAQTSDPRTPRAGTARTPPATAVSSTLSDTTTVGPIMTSEMRYVIASKALKAEQAASAANKSSATGRPTSLAAASAKPQYFSTRHVDELENSQEFGPDDLVEVTTDEGAKYKGKITCQIPSEEGVVRKVVGYMVIGNAKGDRHIFQTRQIKLLKRATPEEAEARLAQNWRDMTCGDSDEAFEDGQAAYEEFSKMEAEARRPVTPRKKDWRKDDGERGNRNRNSLRELAALRKTGISYEVGDFVITQRCHRSLAPRQDSGSQQKGHRSRGES